MKKYATDNGVPSEDVFMDHAGFSTYETDCGKEQEADDFFAYCGLLTENSNELKQEKLRSTAATLAEISANMKNSPDKQGEYLQLDELSRRILAAAQ